MNEVLNHLLELLIKHSHVINDEVDIIADDLEMSIIKLLERHGKIEITHHQGSRVIFKKKGTNSNNDNNFSLNILE